jgi:hypothetical protein
MKLYRNAIILLVVLGLLLGTYFVVIKKLGAQQPDNGTGSIVKIVNINTNDIVEMTVQNKEGKYVFVKNGEEWKLSAPYTFKIDNNAVNSLAINVSSLTASKVLEENATNLAQYGLDKPDVITIKTKDGKLTVVEVGDEAPTRSGYYAKGQGSNKVYLIDSYTGEKLKISENTIRVKNLFDVTSADVIAFGMDRKGKTVFSSKKFDDTTWTMSYPINANVELGEVTPMIDAVTKSTVINYVESNAADLSQYGLDKPSYAFDFETSKGKSKLLLGKEKIKGTEIFAKLDNSNEVFTVDYSTFTFVDKPLKEIMEVFAYIPNIGDVNKIVLEMDGHKDTYDLQVDPEGKDNDKDKFYINGKLAVMKNENGDQYFRKHYQALIGVTLSEIEPDGKPSGKADITITYSLKKQPGTMKVEFIPKDSRYYYVVKNDTYSGILVDRKKMNEPEGVRETYKQLMDALSKQK